MRLAEQFPVGDHKKVGIPAIKNIKDLKAVAAKHQKETMALLKKSGGSTITSMKELKELARKALKNPQAAGEEMIEKARIKNQQKRESQEELKTPTKEETPPPMMSPIDLTEISLRRNLLEEIQNLLSYCKDSYFDLRFDWLEIQPNEGKFGAWIEAMDEHEEAGVDFCVSYLDESTDDEEMDEKKPAAAFTLASMPENETESLNRLIGHWRDNEDAGEEIVKGLKYGLNPGLEERISDTILNEPPYVQAGFVEVLDYRQKTDIEKWKVLEKNAEPKIQAKLLRSYTCQGEKIDVENYKILLDDSEAPYYEDVLLSFLIAGDKKTLERCRHHLNEKPDKVGNIPVILACGSNLDDYQLILSLLTHPDSLNSATYALGIIGLPTVMPLFIEKLSTEEWLIQRKIVDSLELITGAGLDQPVPDIIEGEKGKEYEVSVKTGWDKIWIDWWQKSQQLFDPNLRYRRGEVFDLESCIKEMAYPRGNYWSRQHAYFELQIRSGTHEKSFEADWYVGDQLAAIEKWEIWWQENQAKYSDSQWLFAVR